MFKKLILVALSCFFMVQTSYVNAGGYNDLKMNYFALFNKGNENTFFFSAMIASYIAMNTVDSDSELEKKLVYPTSFFATAAVVLVALATKNHCNNNDKAALVGAGLGALIALCYNSGK